ncbi:MAG: hypothetical protein ABJG78_16045 [Cyclobacteriaceae bacterium]
MKGLIKAGLTCFIFISHFVHGQSIYSFQGLGTLQHQGMPNNVGMGELGIAAPTIWHVNTQNPANLIFNTFSTFQVGVQGDGREFTGDNVSGSDFDGGLRFMAYAFPIKPGKWSSSFGILPFSTVSYNTFTESTVDGDPTVTQFVDESGEGGLTNFYWANGFAINDNFRLGIRFNYRFGSINKKSQISIGGGDVITNTISFLDQTSYSDIDFSLGAGYRHLLTEKKVLNFGLTFSNASDLKGKNIQELTRLSGTGSTIETREIRNTTQEFELPRTLGFGISFQNLNKFLIGIDFESQAWSNTSDGISDFQNQTKFVLGGRWLPDHDNVNSYFKRATYRLGLNYTKLPYIVNNESINDFGINFGASLPVSGFSSIDLAAKFGRLGATDNGLIKESYYQVVIGATINDRWFIKRKYD